MHAAAVLSALSFSAGCAPAQNNTQLGFFFLKREDAEALIDKVGQAALGNERLAAAARRPGSSSHLMQCRWPIPLGPGILTADP
jgi:hypothetical protein